MNVKPVADRVVIKTIDKDNMSKGGLILFNYTKEKSEVSEVIAVGPGIIVNGKRVEMTVKPGDKVIAKKFAGTTIKVDEQEYTIVNLSDILAVVEE